MTTPCELNPEAWVGDDVHLRLDAARRCGTCPILDQCRTRPAPDFGVQAGTDYTPRTPKRPFVTNCNACGLPMIGRAGRSKRCPACVETKTCASCGGLFERDAKASQRQWEARIVCGRACNGYQAKESAA
jgi:hypothetical protein